MVAEAQRVQAHALSACLIQPFPTITFRTWEKCVSSLVEGLGLQNGCAILKEVSPL